MMLYLAQVIAPFISPALAWAGLAMVSIPIAIHLLSRWRRRPQPWGAMRFLLEAYRKQKQRMRFEQWLLLLLRCLIVLLLGLALARPLLAGVLGALFGNLDSRGRVINLVFDNAMSLQAGADSGQQRFNELIDSAEQVIDHLDPGDRVTLWYAGRPAQPIIAEPSRDHQALRSALASLHPGYGRSDVPGALKLIEEAKQNQQDLSSRSVTFVFSDLVRSANYINETPAVASNRISGSDQLVISRPMLPLDNYQVSSITPRRRVVWVGGITDSSVPVEVKVTRFSDDLPEKSVNLLLDLIDSQGRSLSSIRRQITFVNGQNQATLGIDLPVNASSARLDPQGGTLLTIRAKLEMPADNLEADNQAMSAVELRQRMRVAVVDEPAGTLNGQHHGLNPGQWISLALNPQIINTTASIEVLQITPSDLNNPDTLSDIDALLLLRPDRVVRPAWPALKTFVDDGGLLWVFTPPDEGSAPWVSQLVDEFEPGWRIGLEPVVLDETSEGLPLTARPIVAEPLERLAADWQLIVRPVRVFNYLPLNTDESDSWLTFTPEVDDSNQVSNQNVLLAHQRVGLGSLMLLSTAVDTQWTNLPTKPLFVPLIHETLHGVLGTRDRPGVVNAVAGDQPVLGPAWNGATSLHRLNLSDDVWSIEADNAQTDQTPVLKTDESGVTLSDSIDSPGVYFADSDLGPRRLIANPDAVAGDLRAINEEQLSGWLNSLGDWRWLDEENPGSSLAQTQETADIGWVLLWIVLALVLLESLIARLFSHAGAGRSTSLSAKLLRSAIRLRSGDHSESNSGRAA